MPKPSDARLGQGDRPPPNDIPCLACNELRADGICIDCQRGIQSELAKLDINETTALEPRMQAMEEVVKKRRAVFDPSLERTDCAPLGNISCLSCEQPQEHPVYLYCEECLLKGVGATTIRNIDLELKALKEVLMRRRKELGS